MKMSIKSSLLIKVMPKTKEKYLLNKENNLPILMDLISLKYQPLAQPTSMKLSRQ